jgi:hypothetical protein
MARIPGNSSACSFWPVNPYLQSMIMVYTYNCTYEGDRDVSCLAFGATGVSSAQRYCSKRAEVLFQAQTGIVSKHARVWSVLNRLTRVPPGQARAAVRCSALDATGVSSAQRYCSKRGQVLFPSTHGYGVC